MQIPGTIEMKKSKISFLREKKVDGQWVFDSFAVENKKNKIAEQFHRSRNGQYLQIEKNQMPNKFSSDWCCALQPIC